MKSIVYADSVIEALEKSPIKIGDIVKVSAIQADACQLAPGVEINGYDIKIVNFQKIPNLDIQFVTFLNRIKLMNSTFGVENNDSPTDLKLSRLKRFVEILYEEMKEGEDIVNLADAERRADNLSKGIVWSNQYDTDIGENLMVELADWLGDIVIYCCSEARRWGINLLPVLNAILDSQESKLGENGQPIVENGKFVKGPNYKAPDKKIAEILKISRKHGDKDPWYAKRCEDDGVYPEVDEEEKGQN